jgi:hypothetical protein
VCGNTTNHRPKAVSAIDVNIKCAPGILLTASPDIFAQLRQLVARELPQVGLMSRHAQETFWPSMMIGVVLRLVVATLQNAGY